MSSVPQLENKTEKPKFEGGLLPGDPQYRDYLDEDPKIANQRFACISFVAPGADQHCDIVGFKIRGVFATEKEARKKAERIQTFDPDFHVFICKVGYWCPFNPDPNELKDEVYNEGMLNEIVKGYKENRILAEDYNETRKRDLIKQAIRDGAKRKNNPLEENKKEHPVSVKDKLVRLPREIEMLQKQLEESKKQLEEKKKEWTTYSGEEIKGAEEEYKNVVEGKYETEEEKKQKEEASKQKHETEIKNRECLNKDLKRLKKSIEDSKIQEEKEKGLFASDDPFIQRANERKKVKENIDSLKKLSE